MVVEIETSRTEDAFVISLSGELSSRFEQKAVSELVKKELGAGTRSFLFDLSQTDYISSLGIACLAAAYVTVNRANGSLHLVRPNPRVARVLQMTRVDGVFETYATVEEALAAERGAKAN